jgi:hypothetical protein
MKNFKKFAVVLTVVIVLGAAGAAYAAVQSPADIAAGLTGKSVEDLYNARAEGKTYGTIANEEGKLEEFKALMLERKKEILDQRVEEGRLTQEQADEILNSLETNIANCDGTGNGGAAIGRNGGAGFGQGSGMGQGTNKGTGMRNGGGGGRGMGAGIKAGSCIQ